MVVVMPMLVTMLPIASQVLMVRFTPLIPGSPMSWMPLPLRSFQMKSPMVTSAHGAHKVLHVHAGLAGKVLGLQLAPSASHASLRAKQVPAVVVHVPSPCATQVPIVQVPSPAPGVVSQSEFIVHRLPTRPAEHSAQSLLPLRTLQELLSSRPPMQMPLSQSPLTEHFSPAN